MLKSSSIASLSVVLLQAACSPVPIENQAEIPREEWQVILDSIGDSHQVSYLGGGMTNDYEEMDPESDYLRE